MGRAYPELGANRAMIEKTILAEEKRFDAVLSDGLPRLEAEINKVVGTKARTLSGDAAFRLYDTFGVPYDFIEDTAATQGVAIDQVGYERAMEAQRDKARAGSAFGGGRKGEEFTSIDESALKEAGDQFEGYTTTRVTGVPVVALFDETRQPVDELPSGASGYAALAKTPFYLEAGGQVSDTEAAALLEDAARIAGVLGCPQ
jgi:alanyl-tRNA synthetase